MEPQFPFLENGDDGSYLKNTSKDIHAVHLHSAWHVASVPVSVSAGCFTGEETEGQKMQMTCPRS